MNSVIMNKLMWWAYVHSNGTLQLKRWFGDHKDYQEAPGGDCHNNPFVTKIIPPFEAESREAAIKVCEDLLKKDGWVYG